MRIKTLVPGMRMLALASCKSPTQSAVDIDPSWLQDPDVHLDTVWTLHGRQVGQASQFDRDMNTQLHKVYMEFAQHLAPLVEERVGPHVSDALRRVCSRLINKFCPGCRVSMAALVSALQPGRQGRDRSAPLYSWLKWELAHAVELDFVWEVCDAEITLPNLHDPGAMQPFACRF